MADYLVQANIQPIKLNEVKEALMDLGVTVAAIEAKIASPLSRGRIEIYRGAEYPVSFLPKVRLEVMAQGEEQRFKVMTTIMQYAHIGRAEDGEVWYSEVKDRMNIKDWPQMKASIDEYAARFPRAKLK